eukprot:comp23874_c0_seq1/m.41878 comp23874_c0_seq1/g.41878  ORF comp23874_c0_seq1/g.41878 comp23874_c0_seq1/m.41878 type:complete len:864 (-) comp23874_c0_seq1:481-3072(-)
MEKSKRHILPTNVKPLHYDLTLTPNFEDFTYTGEESVKVQVVETTSQITLNAKELTIDPAVLVLEDGNELVGEVTLDPSDDVATFTFKQPVTPQTATLRLTFKGTLNDALAGFYRSSYMRPDGTKSWIATTHMEPTDARRAFPCWDEPLLKATFRVCLRVPTGMTALGNMGVVSVSSVPGTNLTEVQFETSPIMSTYLVAFVVGEFDYVEAHTKEGVRVRTYVPVGHKHQGAFSADVAVKTLSFFTEYFDIAYPLPKLDMVAIPDFAFGAMENWGLVTYRTVVLLFDPDTSPAQYKQRIAYIVGHELAHQWFGNLVTMEWWTDLWLNEGFATWVGWLAVDHIFPDWNVWDQFVLSEVKEGLSLDSLKSSHPIEVEVTHAHQVMEIFDSISYSKGGSAIHMLATHLGKEPFRQGLRNYLKKFAYKNATTEDLWAALSQASGQDVKKMMDSWTKQTGYPVITFQEVNGKLRASQCRFLSTGKEEDETVWVVPVRIYSFGQNATNDVMDMERECDVSLPANSSKWWKANKDQAGFFRVKYPKDMLPKLGEAIASKELSVTDRVGIIGDAFALAAAGYSTTTEALSLLEYFKGEGDYTVWCDVVDSIKKVKGVWYTEDEAVLSRLRALECHLYQPIVNSLGWEVSPTEDHLTHLLRPLVIGAAGKAGDPAIVNEARARLERYFNGDHSAVHPDLRGAVFSTVLANDQSDATFEGLLKLYQTSEAEDERVTVLRVIGGGTNTDLITRALEFGLSDKVRSQDTMSVMASCASNPKGRDVTWKFLQARWTAFTERYGSAPFLLARIVAYTTDVFNSLDKAQEIEAFFTTHSLPAIERTVLQSVETVRANAKWLERDRASVAQWLNENVTV